MILQSKKSIVWGTNFPTNEKEVIVMNENKTITTESLEDARELAAMLAKLPKAIRIRIFDKTDGALMVSDAQKAG